MENEEIKKIYNNLVGEKLRGDYEYNRWFKDELSRAGYDMTRQAVERHFLSQVEFKNYLEVGPGPGTWTVLFLEKNQTAEFDLVDISLEMLKLAKEKLSPLGRFNFFETDFLKFVSEKKYDLFFSSRAIEYFPEKNEFMAKIKDLLDVDGWGFIITKNPKYWSYKIMGRKIPEMHKSQVSPNELKRILVNNNFTNINFYPAAMTFPFLKSAWLNKILYKIFGGCKLNFLSRLFCESYCIKFKKQ